MFAGNHQDSGKWSLMFVNLLISLLACLVVRQVPTLVHPVAGVRGADIGGHQVLLLQLVVEAGDPGVGSVSQLRVDQWPPTLYIPHDR